MLAWAILSVVVVALAVRTVVRNRDWRDNFTLYSAAVRAVPGSAKMRANLGGMYYLAGDPGAAEPELQAALQIAPNYTEAIEAYGLVESQLGRKQQALPLLQKALSMTAKTDINYNFRETNLAALLLELGNHDAALNLLNRQIADSPSYARAWASRAELFYRQGNSEAALADTHAALNLDPSNEQAQSLVRALAQNGSASRH